MVLDVVTLDSLLNLPNTLHTVTVYLVNAILYLVAASVTNMALDPGA